jgi:hypothetical protein
MVNKKKENINPNKPECPICQSHVIYFLARTNSYQCRVCGTKWAKIIKEEKED